MKVLGKFFFLTTLLLSCSDTCKEISEDDAILVIKNLHDKGKTSFANLFRNSKLHENEESLFEAFEDVFSSDEINITSEYKKEICALEMHYNTIKYIDLDGEEFAAESSVILHIKKVKENYEIIYITFAG